MASRLDICNQALAEAGCDPLEDWTDETTEGDFLRRRYPTLYERTITTYPFQFARMMADLDPPVMQADGVTPLEPVGRFLFQYDMPSKPRVLHTNALLVYDAPIRFRVYRRRYLTDSDQRDAAIVVDYQWRAPEEDLPPYVENFLVLKVAAAIASGVREDEAKAAGLETRALAELRTARFTDAKGQTSSRIRTGRMARLRAAR